MTFINTSGDFLGDFPEHTVDLIDKLTDPGLEWSPLETDGQVRRLFCDELILKCNGIDTAQLSMDIGDDVLQIGDSAFAEWAPENIIGKFVRITITQADPIENRVWVGYIKGLSQDRSAVKTNADPDLNVPTGRKQFFQCVGLAYFLDRIQIDTAVIRAGLGTDLRIFRPMTFNGDRSVNYDNDTSKRGNRFTLPQFDEEGDPEGDGALEDFAFTNGEQPGALWSAKDIVRHVLRYHSPVDKADERAPCRYSLQCRTDPDGDEVPDDQSILAVFYPTIPTERRTTLRILNETIMAKRGLCWWTELKKTGFGTPETTPGFIEVKIRVATRAVDDITLPSGGVLTANADQGEFNIDSQVDVEDFKLDEDRIRYYHQVVARGARMTSTATFSTEDGNLEPDWSSDLEDLYIEGGLGGSASLKDIYRRNEKFNPVYACFRIPHDWSGNSGSGLGGSLSPTLPVISVDGIASVDEAVPLSTFGLRVLNTTRLLVGYNYATTADDPDPLEEVPTGSVPDMMKPFAWFIYTDLGTLSYVTRYADKLNKQVGPVGDLTTSYHLHIQQNVPGIIVRATAGEQHKMAGDRWDGTGSGTTASFPEIAFEPGIIYFDTWLGATLTIEADKYAEAVWPETLDHVDDGVVVEKLLLMCGEKYRLDYLAPHTLLYIDDSSGLSAPVLAAGGVIRNDQKELQDIARMAYEWYKVGRQPITVPFKHCKDVFRLGMLITNIGEGSTLVEVNSVVSSIAFDLVRGRMTITTDDDDVDFSV